MPTSHESWYEEIRPRALIDGPPPVPRRPGRSRRVAAAVGAAIAWAVALALVVPG